jgi:hypothetical protein
LGHTAVEVIALRHSCHCFLLSPESVIVRIVELAGLVLILARGLIGHYDDFVDLLEQRQRRR